MRGLGFGMAMASVTASMSMPSSLEPNCSKTETVLQGDVIEGQLKQGSGCEQI
jgi:hypothetical protein